MGIIGLAEPPAASNTDPRKSVLKTGGFSALGIFSKTRLSTPGAKVYGMFPRIFLLPASATCGDASAASGAAEIDGSRTAFAGSLLRRGSGLDATSSLSAI